MTNYSTHDFTRGRWGHDILNTKFLSRHLGIVKMSGIGSGIQKEDRILLAFKAGEPYKYAKYIVMVDPRYNTDPPDLFRIDVLKLESIGDTVEDLTPVQFDDESDKLLFQLLNKNETQRTI